MFPVNNCTMKSRLSPLKGLRQYQRLRSASKARPDSALQASTNITADTRTANLMASVSCFHSLVHGASEVCERLPRICLKQQRKADSCILFCSESRRNARGLPPPLGGIHGYAYRKKLETLPRVKYGCLRSSVNWDGEHFRKYSFPWIEAIRKHLKIICLGRLFCKLA